MKRRSAFSLLEIMLVLTLCGMLLSFFGVKMHTLWEDYRRDHDLSKCKEKIESARQIANLLGVDIRVHLEKEQNHLVLWIEKQDPATPFTAFFKEKVVLHSFKDLEVVEGKCDFIIYGGHLPLPIFRWKLIDPKNKSYSIP